MKYQFRQDDSFHWYMIPQELIERFDLLYQLTEPRIEEHNPQAFEEACEEIERDFAQYRTGGGIENIVFENPVTV